MIWSARWLTLTWIRRMPSPTRPRMIQSMMGRPATVIREFQIEGEQRRQHLQAIGPLGEVGADCRLFWHVDAVDGGVLHVQGLDAIDGTPVIDIKPHMQEFGPRGDVHQPSWADELMHGYW